MGVEAENRAKRGHDDASQDATGEIVQAFAARDPRVQLIRLTQNRGVAGARNAGIREAKGNYVAPLDADKTSKTS